MKRNMKRKNKTLIEKQGWVVMKDSNFPSTNYMLFNKDSLGASECKRVQDGYYPRKGVAYYTNYESAYKRLNLELAEGGL